MCKFMNLTSENTVPTTFLSFLGQKGYKVNNLCYSDLNVMRNQKQNCRGNEMLRRRREKFIATVSTRDFLCPQYCAFNKVDKRAK